MSHKVKICYFFLKNILTSVLVHYPSNFTNTPKNKKKEKDTPKLNKLNYVTLVSTNEHNFLIKNKLYAKPHSF